LHISPFSIVTGRFCGFQRLETEMLQRASRANIAECILRPLGVVTADLVAFRRWRGIEIECYIRTV
jgi:hypothetical protein